MSNGDSSQPATTFTIRPARQKPSDAIFVAEAFDSALGHLASIGSGSQWGSHSRRNDAAFVASMEQHLADSVENEDTSFHIAEKLYQKQGESVKCGGALVKLTLPDYIKESEEAMYALDGVVNFDYLCILIADQRAQPMSRGVGKALIQRVKNEAIRKGRKTLLVDCWDGNEGILASYYCKQGFYPIAKFSKMGKHIENVLWTGLLLRINSRLLDGTMSTPSSLKINLPPTFANSFWSSPEYRFGVEALYAQLQSGLDENASIIALVEHRAALEYSHAEQLATPFPLPTYPSPLFKTALREGTSKNARSFSGNNSSASHAFRAIEAESIQVQAAAHGTVARGLEKTILIPFGKWSEEHQSKVQNSWEYVDANLQRFEKQKAEVDRLRAQYENKCRQADEAEDDARFAGGELTSPSLHSSDGDTMEEKQQHSFAEIAKTEKELQPDAESHQEEKEKAPLDPDRLKRRETLREQFGFRRAAAAAAAGDDKYTSMNPRSVSEELPTFQSSEKDNGVKKSSTLSSALSSALHKASEVPALQNLRAVVGVLNEPRHLRLRKDAENAEASYKDAVRALDKLRCELEEILLEHFTMAERWEVNRLVAVKRVLVAFNAAFASLLPSLSTSLQRSTLLDSDLDVGESLTHLIVDARTGPYQPQPQVFIPYYHDDPSSLSGAGTAGFGMDLSAFMRAETLASESGVVSGEIRAGAGESYKSGMPAIPLALMALLASLERAYDDASRWPAAKDQSESSSALVNAEKRKAWIYEVPLVNTHLCREAIISHLLGKSVPGADVGAGLETKLKRFDPPTLAATAKIWAMELSDSLVCSTLWDSVDNTYRAAAGQEYDSRATPSKTVGEATQEKTAEGSSPVESTAKGKARAEGLDPVLEETIRKGVLADLNVILSKLPKIHLVCLDAMIGHLARLIKATPVEESNSVYLNKVALALSRVLIRPPQETARTLRSRAPVLFAHDLIKYYDNLLPSLLAKKAKESEAALLSQRRTPIRKRTKPVDQRMSRTRMAASSSSEPLPRPVAKDEAPPASHTPPKIETKVALNEEEEDDDNSVTPIGSRILSTLPIKKDEETSRIKSPVSTSSSAYDTPEEASDEKVSIKSSSPSITTSTSNATFDEDKKLSNVARLSRQFGSSGSVKSMVRGPRAAGGPRAAKEATDTK